MKVTIFQKSIIAGIFCLFATVLTSPFVGATVAPLTFTDNSADSVSTIIHTGTPDAGNSFIYLISSDVNAVPVPTDLTDFSAWSPVIDGQSIIALNGQHIGVAEINPLNLPVDFRDATAITLIEKTAPSASANDNTNTIDGIDNTMEFEVDNTGYVAYDGSNLPNLAGNHTVLVRVAAVSGISNSSPAVTLGYTFKNLAPAAPLVSADDELNIISGLTTAMEFNVDTTSYIRYDGTNAPVLTGNHFVVVRIAEDLTTDTPAGLITSLFFTTNLTTPIAPSVTADDANNIITGIDNSMEYSIDGLVYTTYDAANAPVLYGVHTVDVRVAAIAGVSKISPVTTVYFTYTQPVPAAPSVTADDFNNVINGLVAGMEFNIDATGYVAYDGSNFPIQVGDHFVAVRIAENVSTDTPSGLATNLFFYVDPAPVITGVLDGQYYDNSVVVSYSGSNITSALMNGSAFVSGTTVSVDGVYTLVVTDLAGKVTSVTFTIDTTDPIVSGVVGGYTNSQPTVIFSDTNISSAMLDGSVFVSGTTVTDGTYVLVVTDLAGNTTTVNFTVDTVNPLVSGVTNNTYYNTDVTVTFSDINLASATLNGNPFVSSTVVSGEGIYTLTVTDLAGNITTVNFTIDKTAPVVNGVIDNAYYNVDKTVTFSDINLASATLNGTPIISGDIVSTEGIYILVVTDLAGNVTTVTFTIDKTVPVVTGVNNGVYYNADVTVAFSDINIAGATMNGNPFVSGTIVSVDGVYILVVTDLAGNTTTVNFTIDKTNPTITTPTNGDYYNTNVTLVFSDTNLASAMLNSTAVLTGDVVSAEGIYTLVVTDLAGNTTTINFTIDKTTPIVTSPIDGNYYSADVTVAFSDINLAAATLDGNPIISGATATTEGVHVLIVTDLAGNSTTVTFTIDKTNPNIAGVVDGSYVGGGTTITFSDTNLSGATLNGSLFVSGTTVSGDGVYILVVTDLAGNTSTAIFTIDTVNPVIAGVSNGTYYSGNTTITFSDTNFASASLDGSSVASGVVVSTEGVHTLVVTDLAGNTTTVTFTIDKTGPQVNGVVDGDYLISQPTITFADTNLAGATLNGSAFISGTTVTDGIYVLVVTDLAGNSTTINFTVDTSPVVISGVADGAYYNSDVTATITGSNIASVTMDGSAYVSGTPVTTEGLHTVVVTRIIGGSTTVTFTIDKTVPTVTNPVNGTYYSADATLAFADINLAGATVDGAVVVNGAIITTEGIHTLVVTDLAGNTTTVIFTIDKTTPIVTGVINSTYYNADATVAFSDTNLATATLDGNSVLTGDIVATEGVHVLVVTDLAGNSITITFTIDKTNPVVTGVVSGTYYNAGVTVVFSDANLSTATINGNPVVAGTVVSAEGIYVLLVTDLAGNTTTINFAIDKTAPVVNGVINAHYNYQPTVTFSDTNIASATLDGAAFTSGSVVGDGNHTLIVTDMAGNVTTINFVVTSIVAYVGQSVDDTTPTVIIDKPTIKDTIKPSTVIDDISKIDDIETVSGWFSAIPIVSLVALVSILGYWVFSAKKE